MSDQLHTPSPPREGRILVVDDELSIRKPIRIALLQAGYEVVEAVDGQEAINALGEGDNPLLMDAILCDIRMPRINGIDAIYFFPNTVSVDSRHCADGVSGLRSCRHADEDGRTGLSGEAGHQAGPPPGPEVRGR